MREIDDLDKMAPGEKLTRERLLELRTYQGLSYVEIGRLLKTSPSNVGKYVRKYKIPLSELAPKEQLTRERLIELRIYRGLSYNEIARLLNISPSSVSNYVRKHNIPKTKTHMTIDRERRKRRVIKLYKSGDYTLTGIANLLELRRESIINILRSAGFTTRTTKYRNRRINQLFKDGATATELSVRFSISRNNIMKRILKDKGGRLDPEFKYSRIKVDAICCVCGEVYHTTQRKQQTCSAPCGVKNKFLMVCEEYLEIREMRRQGKRFDNIGKAFGKNPGTVRATCSNAKSVNAWCVVLAAIESIRRHKGKRWLSGTAKIEKHHASALLRKEKLFEPLTRKGIL